MRWHLVALITLAGCEFDVGMLDPADLSRRADGQPSGDLSQTDDLAPEPPDMALLPSLSVARADFSAALTLTGEGTVDWMHFGLAVAGDVNRKAGTPVLTAATTGTALQYGAYSPTFSWTNGTPTANSTTHSGIWVNGIGNGFTISAPTGPTTRTLRLYVSQDGSTSTLLAHVANGSVPDVTRTNTVPTGNFTQLYTVTVQTTSPSTLTVSFTNAGSTGDVDLLAVTLQ